MCYEKIRLVVSLLGILVIAVLLASIAETDYNHYKENHQIKDKAEEFCQSNEYEEMIFIETTGVLPWKKFVGFKCKRFRNNEYEYRKFYWEKETERFVWSPQ